MYTLHCNICLCLQWVPEITHHCPKTPFLLVGFETDLRDDPETIKSLCDAQCTDSRDCLNYGILIEALIEGMIMG